MRLIAIIALALVSTAEARPYDDIMQEARAAFAAEDFDVARERLDEAQIERPYSLYLTRNRVLARILTDRMEEAIAIVQEVADRGLVLELPPNEEFERMQAEAAFAPIAAKMAENARPIGEARTTLEYERNDLLPEALAIHDGAFYVGSVRTGEILEFHGETSRVVAQLNGGVFDIEVVGPSIYGVANNQLTYNATGERPAEAIIFKLDRATGNEEWRRIITDSPALLGDIEIMPLRIYTSDSLSPRVFVQDPDLTPRVQNDDPRFANVQGIALDKKKKRLFVADYLTGLFVVDLKSGDAAQIANPTDAHLGGIDGLYLHKGDLIGVQNGTSPQRIVRIGLSKDGKTAKSLCVLQQALPEWNEPTHGVVDDGKFVYIATSNWPAYDDDGNVREGAELKPLRIMETALDANGC